MKVSDWLSVVLVGIVIGALGRLVLPGRQRVGVFATFVLGVGAAVLGYFAGRVLGFYGDHPAHVWFVHWDWVVLAVQVGLAIVGIAIANVLTYTRLADDPRAPRRGTARRRRRTSGSSA
jgi:uncharacterized membrane protein YeaQ/YmgE (transglycosylase-associated protein family)